VGSNHTVDDGEAETPGTPLPNHLDADASNSLTSQASRIPMRFLQVLPDQEPAHVAFWPMHSETLEPLYLDSSK
jgi:hypothetical protein